MIALEINGLTYDNFTKIAARRCYDQVPSDFSFVATVDPSDVRQFPILVGDICRVLVNDMPFITGFIDDISVRHSEGTHTINVRGASLVVDLVQSTMDSTFEIAGPIPLQTALENILAKMALNVAVIDKTGVALDPLTEAERLSGEVGSSVWSFMCQAALKRNVLLTEDGFGNVVMTRGGGERLQTQFVKKVNGEFNNLLASNIARTANRRFHRFKVCSQPNATDLANIDFSTGQLVTSLEPEAESIDDMIRTSRLCAITAEQSSTKEQCLERAVWQSNVSRTQGFVYECTRVGYTTSDGILIEPGQTVYVCDEFMSLNAELMIQSASLSYSDSGGSLGTYRLGELDSFTLTANQPTFKQTGNDLEGIFSAKQD